jgi:hypothetical protein
VTTAGQQHKCSEKLSGCFMPGLLSLRRSIQDKVLMFEPTKAGENVG